MIEKPLFVAGLVCFVATILGSCASRTPTPPSAKEDSRCDAPKFQAAPFNVATVPSFSLAPNLIKAINSSLTIVSDGDIDIGGQVKVTNPVAAGPVNITFVSLKGDIIIENTGVLDGGKATSGSGTTSAGIVSEALGNPGTNGGLITLYAANGSINVMGSILGAVGGEGGEAKASSVGPPSLRTRIISSLSGILFGAVFAQRAVGGIGGFGGDILLCAKEVIHVGAPAGAAKANIRIQAGLGGEGGGATAMASAGGSAFAQAGNFDGTQGAAGDVIISSINPNNALVQVFIDGVGTTVQGGDGIWGAQARATGGTGLGPGGSAVAIGGNAAKAGTVKFLGAVVSNPRGRLAVLAGAGMAGGSAFAFGGDGGTLAGFSGFRGGDASATGGSGSPPVAPPTYLDGAKNPWGPSFGAPGDGGRGGPATSSSGSGGLAGPPAAQAGASGAATAEGGSNGAGIKPPAPDFAGSKPPIGGLAGSGQSASQAGVK